MANGSLTLASHTSTFMSSELEGDAGVADVVGSLVKQVCAAIIDIREDSPKFRLAMAKQLQDAIAAHQAQRFKNIQLSVAREKQRDDFL